MREERVKGGRERKKERKREERKGREKGEIRKKI